jgi:hypothetical protein
MSKDYWEKLSFIIDGDDRDGEEEGYRDKLYAVLEELFQRTDKLQSKSHIHRSQLPEYKEKWEELKKLK